VAQAVEHYFASAKALSSNPNTTKKKKVLSSLEKETPILPLLLSEARLLPSKSGNFPLLLFL
jgi:hypothetical protein